MTPPVTGTSPKSAYGFVIPVADEGPVQLESCLGFLRSAYPDAPVVVISDGCKDPGYEAACKRFCVPLVNGEYLKRIECGGAWWFRLLSLGLTLDTRWIIKLDADARIWRPFQVEPKFSIAGTLEGSGTDLENVQGGVQAIHRSAAKKIVASKLTEDPALTQHWTFNPSKDLYREWNARAYFCSDKALFWLARHLGIDQGDWPEVNSRWLPPAPPNEHRRYAATHPHKLELDPRHQAAKLRVITICKGRLHHLKQTLPRWLAETGVSVTVVDYGCPDGTADWLAANHPEVDVLKVTGPATDKFNLARARNIGAAHTEPGWWCFWDADCLCEPGWANAIRRSLHDRRYLLASPIEWGQFGSVVVHSHDYGNAGGYDEAFRAWGSEDSDFYLRLRHTGIRPGSFPGKYFSSIPHDEAARTAHYDVKRVEDSRLLYDAYIRRKRAHMLKTGKMPDEATRKGFLLEACAERPGTAADFLRPQDGPPPRFEVEVRRAGVALPKPEKAKVYTRESTAPQIAPRPTDLATAQPADNSAAPGSPAATPTQPSRPAGQGPMLSMSLHAHDARFDVAIDIGEMIANGLKAGPTIAKPVVASEHVAR